MATRVKATHGLEELGEKKMLDFSDDDEDDDMLLTGSWF